MKNTLDFNQINKTLQDILLNRKVRADRFDSDYIDDFHHIIRENYGIDTVSKFFENKKTQKLVELLNLSKDEIGSLQDITTVLQEHKTSLDGNFKPLTALGSVKQRHKYTQTPIWKKAVDVVANEQRTNVDIINDLQKQYSILSGGDKKEVPKNRIALRKDWLPEFKAWKAAKLVTTESNVLTIGPRWGSEITYFRKDLGFKNTIGLDLFSMDESLIKIGDMHAMPFEDNTFDMVYQRNTFNKSYDVRKAIDECIRVLRNDGLLVLDDCVDYVDGVSELARTNVVSVDWYGKYIGRNNIKRVLVCKELSIKRNWLRKLGLFAVQIKKGK